MLKEVELSNKTLPLATPLAVELDFWLQASAPALAAVWENAEDELYAELLAK